MLPQIESVDAKKGVWWSAKITMIIILNDEHLYEKLIYIGYLIVI